MWQEPGTYRSKTACAHMELIRGGVGYAQPAMDFVGYIRRGFHGNGTYRPTSSIWEGN